ncbi:MAG: Amidohydrolase [Firmicutes bacterium ADurb.Bin193]|nr:MAG: Amidohydrolase [Firmicutes bacterium ADurb.Bin193]
MNTDGIKVVDCHTHVFTDKIAQKAVLHLVNHYRMPWSGDGTLTQLLKMAPVAVFSTATKPEQVVSINDYIASLSDERLICFGTIHPDFSGCEAEIERISALGLKGIKLHPDFQGFAIDDPRMMRIYDVIGSRLPVLIHLGDENSDYSAPRRLSKVLKEFPSLTVIGAHMGGYMRWDEAREHLIGKNLYLDTSSTLCRISPERMGELIGAHGADRVLFGTDYPARLHKEELENFMKVPLKDSERAKILSLNAISLFNL